MNPNNLTGLFKSSQMDRKTSFAPSTIFQIFEKSSRSSRHTAYKMHTFQHFIYLPIDVIDTDRRHTLNSHKSHLQLCELNNPHYVNIMRLKHQLRQVVTQSTDYSRNLSEFKEQTHGFTCFSLWIWNMSKWDQVD